MSSFSFGSTSISGSGCSSSSVLVLVSFVVLCWFQYVIWFIGSVSVFDAFLLPDSFLVSVLLSDLFLVQKWFQTRFWFCFVVLEMTRMVAHRMTTRPLLTQGAPDLVPFIAHRPFFCAEARLLTISLVGDGAEHELAKATWLDK